MTHLRKFARALPVEKMSPAQPIDPVRRAALVDALNDQFLFGSVDPVVRAAACEDLLQRARTTWADLLIPPAVSSDPEKVRQATVLGYVVHELRDHAEPLWLPVAALWVAHAGDDPEAIGRLTDMVSKLMAREDARLAEKKRRGWPQLPDSLLGGTSP